MTRQASAASVNAIVPAIGWSQRLLSCLRAMLDQSATISDVLVVFDGATPPPTIGLVDPRLRVMTSTVTGSFCAAVNQGIRATSAAWVLVLNDDVVLEPHFLERLFAHLPVDPQIGMACGRLRSGDGVRLDSTGQFRRRNWTARERGYGEVDRGQYDQPGYVESVCAAAALYRREMLEQIAENGQYFDERFGMYLEDLDLGLRAQRAGWHAYYVPQATGVHLRGATAKRQSVAMPWLARYYLPHLPTPLLARYVRNRYRLIRKHATWDRVVRDFPWMLGYELRLWAFLLCCRPAAIQALRHVEALRVCPRAP